jgi:hypothetical protein
VEVILENELRIPLTLSNMALLWTFSPEGEEEENCVGNEVRFETKVIHVSSIWSKVFFL